MGEISAGRSTRDTEAKPQAAWKTIAIALTLGVYLLFFFGTPLTALPLRRDDGSPFRRIDLCVQALLAESPIGAWFVGCSPVAIGERLLLLSATLLYLAVAWAAGRVMLRLLRIDGQLTRLERAIFAVTAGLALLSLFTLIVGLAGLLNRAVFTGLFLCIAVAAFARPNSLRTSAEPVAKSWLWLLAPLALFTLLAGMMPPLDFDVREYHLQAPKEFFQNGRITFLPHNIYANMPLGAEMHALAAMVVVGDWWWGALIGKTVLAAIAPLTAIALFAFGQRFFSTSVGVVAAIVYLSTPWTMLVSTSGLIDGAVSLYAIMAIFSAAIWWRSQAEIGFAALAGWFVGAAVACKYPALLFVAFPLGLAFAYQSLRTTNGRSLCAFAVAATIVCAPWFLKNLALTGNPTYPLLYNVFDGTTRTPDKNEQWMRAHRPSNYSTADLMKKIERVAISSEWLSPVAVPLALVGIILNWRRNSLVPLLVGYLVFVFVAWWLFTHRIDRFLVPTIPVFALLAGAATIDLSERWTKRIMVTATIFAAGYGLLLQTSGVLGDNRFFAPLEELRGDPLVVSAAHQFLNSHRNDVDRILLVGDAEPFDLQAPALYNTCFDNCVFEQLVRDKSTEEVRQAFVAQGISHILVRWDEIARYRSPGNYGFTNFVQPEVFKTLESAGVIVSVPEGSTPASQLYRTEIFQKFPVLHPKSAAE